MIYRARDAGIIGKLKQENQELKEKLDKALKIIDSYCCCNIMGPGQEQCCFCDDLIELKKGDRG